MNPRLKTLIGSVAILVFLFFYVVVVLAIGDHVPEHWAAQLAFFGIAGIAWGIPLIPLMKWMGRQG